MPSLRFLFLTIGSLAACHPAPPSGGPTVAHGSDTWPTRQLAHFSIRLPPAYQSNTASDCFFVDTTNIIGGPGVQNACLSVVPVSEGASKDFAVANASTAANCGPGTHCFDTMEFTDIRTDTIALGGRAAVVQRALGSGGLNGYHDVAMVIIKIPIPPDSLLLVQGEYGDAVGYRELLSAVSTIERH
jgi:hypothetical protein